MDFGVRSRKRAGRQRPAIPHCFGSWYDIGEQALGRPTTSIPRKRRKSAAGLVEGIATDRPTVGPNGGFRSCCGAAGSVPARGIWRSGQGSPHDREPQEHRTPVATSRAPVRAARSGWATLPSFSPDLLRIGPHDLLGAGGGPLGKAREPVDNGGEGGPTGIVEQGGGLSRRGRAAARRTGSARRPATRRASWRAPSAPASLPAAGSHGVVELGLMAARRRHDRAGRRGGRPVPHPASAGCCGVEVLRFAKSTSRANGRSVEIETARSSPRSTGFRRRRGAQPSRTR